MTTETTKTEQTSRTGVIPYRLTVRQFTKMIDAGIFPDRARVELLGGLLVERMTKKTPHNFAVDELARRLRELVEPAHTVREEKSIQLGRWSRPEPDIVVLRGSRETYRNRDPQTEDVLVVVEVADSTHAKDRKRMWQVYATAGVPTYWIVNLPTRRVEVYSDPSDRGKAAGYREAKFLEAGAEVPVVVEGREAGRVVVGDVLP